MIVMDDVFLPFILLITSERKSNTGLDELSYNMFLLYSMIVLFIFSKISMTNTYFAMLLLHGQISTLGHSS